MIIYGIFFLQFMLIFLGKNVYFEELRLLKNQQNEFTEKDNKIWINLFKNPAQKHFEIEQ